MPRWQVFEIPRGADITLEIDLSPVPAGGIAGWTIQYTQRTDWQPNGTLVFTKSTTGGTVVITDAVNGKIQVAIFKADTAGVTPATQVFDVSRIDSGSEGPLTWGLVGVLAEATV
jgi:hypothetical protein